MRTLFCISRNTRIRILRAFTLWFEWKQRIRAARLIQKSVSCLRSVDNLQNGATVTRRDREEAHIFDYIWLFSFCTWTPRNLKKLKHCVNSTNKYIEQTYIKLFQTGPTSATCTGAPQTPAIARGAVTDQSTVPSIFHTVNSMLTFSGQHN